jgi:hypothetical protein
MAVYVKKLNWFTPVYMALISPLLKWVIYPAMMKGVRRRWEEAFPAGAGGHISPAPANRSASRAA